MTISAEPKQACTAIIAIIVSVAALSLSDAIIKTTKLSLPLWQLFILRSVLVVPVLWCLARRRGPINLSNAGWALVRSILLVCMWLSYYSALPFMPLSLAAAAYYTGPLFIVILAALSARQMPTFRAIMAIAFSFAGVLLIVRPDTSGITFKTLLPIIAAFLYGCAMVLTSVKCKKDDPFVLALILNMTFVGCGAFLGMFAVREGSVIFDGWQTINLQMLATVAALSVLILVGSVGTVFAYQKGAPLTVAAFDYSYLVFSLIWGRLFFAEWPGNIGLIGIGVIIGAGLLALPKRQI